MTVDPRQDDHGSADPELSPSPDMSDIIEGPVGSASLKLPEDVRRASAGREDMPDTDRESEPR